MIKILETRFQQETLKNYLISIVYNQYGYTGPYIWEPAMDQKGHSKSSVNKLTHNNNAFKMQLILSTQIHV